MICADTSVWSDYLANIKNKESTLLSHYLTERTVVLSPIILCELISFTVLSEKAKFFIKEIPCLPMNDLTYLSAGEMRCKILGKKLKSRLPDALIAQVCIDTNTPLLTTDRDFRHYIKFGLKIIKSN